MPTHRNAQKYKTQPWHARVKRDYIEYSLGYYATQMEAIQAEDEFKATMPSVWDKRGKNQQLES